MSLAEAVRRHLFDSGNLDPAAGALARFVAETGSDAVQGVLFYGSRRTGATPDPWSAYDFFVLTSDDDAFYRALKARGRLRRGPWLVAALNAVLPPNQTSLREGGFAQSPLAKCAVIRLETLERETSPQRRDHFCAGRLFQPTTLAWARDDGARDRIADCVVAAHEATWTWVRPWLPGEFDSAEYCRTALRISLGKEIRPEPVGRSDGLFEAQRAYLVPIYASLLAEIAERGKLVPRGGERYSLAQPVRVGEKRRIEAYFRRSKFRATARWFKYILTFDDWLEYIVRKAQRHSGEVIELSDRERRWPLLFLWPRVVGYLRRKDRRS